MPDMHSTYYGNNLQSAHDWAMSLCHLVYGCLMVFYGGERQTSWLREAASCAAHRHDGMCRHATSLAVVGGLHSAGQHAFGASLAGASRRRASSPTAGSSSARPVSYSVIPAVRGRLPTPGFQLVDPLGCTSPHRLPQGARPPGVRRGAITTTPPFGGCRSASAPRTSPTADR
jgi:hypothetical protein